MSGAADDDPSGVVTYSIAGARFGTGLLWSALFTWPLMAAVQLLCSRIGMITGRGLVGALRHRLPNSVVMIFALSLLAANTINIGADLSAMADAAELFSGVSSRLWVVVLGAGIAWATVRLPYAVIARSLKWLTLFLFAYVICALHIGPDWGEALTAILRPKLPGGEGGAGMWSTLVAIFGTTISPYLFFWQASQEVEVERAMGRATVAARRGASQGELRERRLDVLAGTFLSNLVMFFIMLTTSMTLHSGGLTEITSSRDATIALQPIAGGFASALYGVAIIGVGLLAIPTLSGSAAYALAETFRWQSGLDRKAGEAPAFYATVVLATLGGIAMRFLDLNPIKTLYWSAVINGMLAPFLLLGVLRVSSDRRLMHGQPASRLVRGLVGVTIALLFGAAGGMLFL